MISKSSLISIVQEFSPIFWFQYLSIGRIDFKKQDFETLHFDLLDQDYCEYSPIYDLASLSKPFNLGFSYLLEPNLFTAEMMSLLNHKSGLPFWGRLSRNDWRDHLLALPIGSAKTCYSDYGALRLQLELERNNPHHFDEIQRFWSPELTHWLKLDSIQKDKAVITGYRQGQEIRGTVHDDNAFSLGSFSVHTGYFSNCEDLCRALLKYDERTKLIETMVKVEPCEQRFINGWDRVTDTQTTLAGFGAGPKTFGHLGFTGTSLWIDPEKSVGVVILSNATSTYWYERKLINRLRKAIGDLLWTSSN